MNENSEEMPDMDENEVKAAMNEMKLNKAPGKDGILVEMLKYEGPFLIKEVTYFLNQCLHKGEIPLDWWESCCIKKVIRPN